jgi:predicted nucleic acid-binding protein
VPAKAVYDTRFFIEYFYSKDKNTLKKLTENLIHTRKRVISTVTIYEIYKLILSREGRDVAKYRTDVITRDFQVENLTPEIAIRAAEINHGTGNPMADSVIAATAQIENAPVITDDPHFEKIINLKTHWPNK